MASPSGNGWNARAIPRQPCAGIWTIAAATTTARTPARVGLGRTALLRRARRPCRQRRRGRGADLAGRPVDGGAHARGDQRQAGPSAGCCPARPRASAKRPPARASHASPMTAAPPWARAVCAMPLFVAQRLLPDIRAWLRPGGARFAARGLDGVELRHGRLSAGSARRTAVLGQRGHQGQGLGYVVSTHQLLRVARSRAACSPPTML